MLNFNYPEKGLRLVSLPYIIYYFLKIMFPMLYSINHCLITFISRDIGQYVY